MLKTFALAIRNALIGQPHSNSLSKSGGIIDKALGWATLGCFILWGFGVGLPLMTITKVWYFDDTYSVATFIIELWKNNEWLLFALLLVFGIGVPVFKLDQMFRVWRCYDISGDKISKAFKRIDLVSKWSMGDVFVVAVTLVILKTSGVMANANVEPGLYFFAASALGSMVVSFYLKRSFERSQGE